MNIDISQTLYERTDIRLSARLAVQVLERAATRAGIVWMSYDKLAIKMNVCRRTAIRAIHKIAQDGARIVYKKVQRRRDSPLHEINMCRFTVPFQKLSAHPFNGDRLSKMSPTPKNPEEERKEDLRSLREEIRIQEKMLRILDLTPGSIPYEELAAKIARLQARLAELTSAPEG
jgi:hypothetical protein